MVIGAPAMACNCVRLFPGTPQFEQDLGRILSHADIIAEGTIVQGHGPLLEPAIFRPSRVLRGQNRTVYRIGIQGGEGCVGISNGALTTRELAVGTPILIILSGGPGVYEASRCANMLGPEVEAAIRNRLDRR